MDMLCAMLLPANQYSFYQHDPSPHRKPGDVPGMLPDDNHSTSEKGHAYSLNMLDRITRCTLMEGKWINTNNFACCLVLPRVGWRVGPTKYYTLTDYLHVLKLIGSGCTAFGWFFCGNWIRPCWLLHHTDSHYTDRHLSCATSATPCYLLPQRSDHRLRMLRTVRTHLMLLSLCNWEALFYPSPQKWHWETSCYGLR